MNTASKSNSVGAAWKPDSALINSVVELLTALIPFGCEPPISLRSSAELVAMAVQSSPVVWKRRWTASLPAKTLKAIQRLRIAAESPSVRQESLRAAVADLTQPAWLALYDQQLNMLAITNAVARRAPLAARLTATDLEQISTRARYAEKRLAPKASRRAQLKTVEMQPASGRRVDGHVLALAVFTRAAFEAVAGADATNAGGTSAFEMLLTDVFALAGLTERDVSHYGRKAILQRENLRSGCK